MIEQVRRFNRAVTQRAGALEDAFLARGRPLGQARVLWEIGPDGCDVRDLRARLGLDSGYLSRLLRALEQDGLITVGVSEADGRRRSARLTVQGQAERGEYDRRSDDAAAALLGPLSGRQRERLVAAMAEVERLLAAAAVEIGVRDPAEPDARRCLRAYEDELSARIDGGFDPARSNSAADHEMTPPAGPVPGRDAARRAGWLRRAEVPRRGPGRAQAHVGLPRRTRPRPRAPAPGRAGGAGRRA